MGLCFESLFTVKEYGGVTVCTYSGRAYSSNSCGGAAPANKCLSGPLTQPRHLFQPFSFSIQPLLAPAELRLPLIWVRI